MTGTVFINYRRGDDPGTTGRIYDRLEAEFTAGQLFMDVEGHIKGGDDFVDVLKAQVARCDVFLAIIGPRWLTIPDEQGRRRLDNPDDWVRVEIASALAMKKRVIPVLVGGADIPRAEDLPEDLKPLARRQVIRITLERFKADVQGLVSQIKGALADIARQAQAASAAETSALAEAERQRAAEEEARIAERVRQELERQRAALAAGMSGEDVRKAEELANWEFIKAKSDPAEFRDHLARYAGGPTARFAEERLAGLEWLALDRKDKAALRAFIDEFPKAPDIDAAKTALGAIEAAEAAEQAAAEARARETEAWGAVAAGTDKAAIAAFLKAWPNGQHRAAAEARLKELRNAGRFSRRAVLKGVGYGVGGTVAVGGAAYATFVPGMPVWRLIHDQSIRTFTGHANLVTSVAFAPDGRTALSGSGDNTLKLWDVATGKTMRTFTGHARSVTSVAFAPDGRTALSGSDDNTLKLWDVATGKTLRTFTGHTDAVRSVTFAPDGRTALSGSNDYTLKLWDVATGKTLRTLTGHSGWTVAFAPDGRTALSGSFDPTLWDVATGEALHTFTGHTWGVNSVAFAPDGRTALSGGGSYDPALKLWDLTPYLPAAKS
jgi:hypothetical protein